MCIMVWLNTVLGALRKPLPIFGGPHSAVLAIGAPLAAQKLTQRSASSPLSSLEKHFIAPPSYKTTSKYSKILRVHAIMGRQVSDSSLSVARAAMWNALPRPTDKLSDRICTLHAFWFCGIHRADCLLHFFVLIWSRSNAL